MQQNVITDHYIDNILATMETRINPYKALTSYEGKNLEMPGIDPGTSRMLSGRSTI